MPTCIVQTYNSNDDGLTPIYSADDFAQLVHDNIEFYSNQAARATERANLTEEQVRAKIHNEFEKENARLKERLHFSFGFLSSEKELEAWHNFIEKHNKCRLGKKIDGGKMPYIIPYGTGFGQSVTAVCQVCGEQENITDTSVW